MEMKNTQREIKELDLPEIIRSIIELFQLEIKKKGLGVVFENEEKIQYLKGDKDEITRLFTNLISNGIKYNKQNGLLIIRFTKDDDYLVTEIKDSGIGMRPEEKTKLFHEFFRAKNEFTKDISGTGLGLSIVKRIVDSYAGKIEVDSEYGSGTTFRVFLPSVNTIKKEKILMEKYSVKINSSNIQK
jgi:signal transduction histidine kinase